METRAMIIVVAALEFANQSDRDKAVALVADVQRLTREEEPGCHDYCFSPDPAVPTRMQVYELWEDSDSLAAHFEHPYYDQMASLLRGVGAAPIRPISSTGASRSTPRTVAKRRRFFRTDRTARGFLDDSKRLRRSGML
jgi:quinol monooxygenase YgiN